MLDNINNYCVFKLNLLSVLQEVWKFTSKLCATAGKDAYFSFQLLKRGAHKMVYIIFNVADEPNGIILRFAIAIPNRATYNKG